MTLQIQLLLAALVAAFSFGGGWTLKGWKVDSQLERKDAQIAKINADYDKERLKAQEQLALAAKNNRQAEQHLQAVADQERLKANEKIATVSRRADSLAVRVRNAETAAATAKLVSATTKTACAGQAAPGDSGAELLRPLGSADVLEAERADKIRVALGACYAQYDAARAKGQE